MLSTLNFLNCDLRCYKNIYCDLWHTIPPVTDKLHRQRVKWLKVLFIIGGNLQNRPQ